MKIVGNNNKYLMYRAFRIMEQIFHPAKFRKHTRIKAYELLARPILTYARETRTIRKQDEQDHTRKQTG
jgi:hypothetical protein